MTLVDSNVLLDIFTEDADWFDWSSRQLANLAETHVLAINPIIYAEVGEVQQPGDKDRSLTVAVLLGGRTRPCRDREGAVESVTLTPRRDEPSLEVSVHFSRIEELEESLPAEDFRRLPLPWSAGFLAGRCLMQCRRRGGARRSPFPDFYIGAHAAVQDLCLLTRDPARHRTCFPAVSLIAPNGNREGLGGRERERLLPPASQPSGGSPHEDPAAGAGGDGDPG